MASPLTEDELRAALAQAPAWSGGTDGITRAVTAPSFLAGIELVVQVAHAAEAANHHPDIDIRWRTVTFHLSTHSAGGVTALDLTLAREIDTLVTIMNEGPPPSA